MNTNTSFKWLARSALAAFALMAAVCYAEQGYRVGPTVTPDQLSRDSTFNPNRASSQYVPLPPPNPCSASTVNWSQGSYTCSASYPGGADGSTTNVQDTVGSPIGSASVMCSNGTATATGTCAPPLNCTSAAQTWTVSGKSCTATPPSTAHGSTVAVNDTTGPDVGNASYTCDNGAFVAQAGATCGTQCSSQAMTWTTGSSTCTATVPVTNNGNAATVTDSVGPDAGSATYSCSNGTWTQTAGSCSTTCAAQVLSWNVGGKACSQTAPSTSGGSSASLTDNTGPETGAATYLCSAGTFVLQGGATCATTTASCAATTVSWMDGSNSCSASYSGGAHGTSQGVTDATAPLVGSGTATCNNGSVTASGTCGSQCPSGQSFTWEVASKSCSGTTSTVGTPGNSRAVSASGTNAGTASFMCNTNGAWSTTPLAGATCGANGGGDGGASCTLGAGTAWNDGGTYGATCQLNDTVTWPSGTQLQVVDSAGFYRGSATGTCSNGTYNVINSSCAAAYGGSPPCPATTQSWTVGTATCVGSLPNGDTNTSYNAADTNSGSDGGSLGTTGLKPYVCNGSSWQAAGGTTTCNQNLSCPSGGAANWGAACTATLPSGVGGTSANLSNTRAGYTGGATYTCSGSTGQWSGPTGASCTATVVGCPSISMEWQSGDFCGTPGNGNACCSGTFPAASSDQTTSVSDTTDPSRGTAYSYCYNGTRSYSGYGLPAPTCTFKCAPIPAGIYRESDAAAQCAGADNLNLAVTTSTAIGGLASIYFSGTTSRATFQCVDPPFGTNNGYKYVRTDVCN